MKILITGGSRGIGKFITEELLKKNHEVIVLSKNKKSIENITKEFISFKKFKAIQCNISDYSFVEKSLKNIDFDALINCAGILGPVDDFLNNDIDEWIETINVNLLGTIYTNKIAINKFVKDKNKYNKIINFSGGGAAFSRVKHSAYAVAKTGIVRFTEIISEELKNKNFNIDVNVIAPGAHKTDMWNSETFDEEPEKWADKNKLIELIEFLLSNKSKGISGRFIHINDDYKNINYSNKDVFTLRRIDDRSFKKV